MKKVILHLCADLGSDSYPYQLDPTYTVIRIGKDFGVENVTMQSLRLHYGVEKVHGIIANPVCLEFSTARKGGKARNPEEGMILVRECQRVIQECNPDWYVIENPGKGKLRSYLGKPDYVYQPWWYGSPWSKQTALWGKFKIPPRLYENFLDIPEEQRNIGLRIPKPTKWSSHHSSFIPEWTAQWCISRWKCAKEFKPFWDKCLTFADWRSLCSQKFAEEFKKYNP